MLQISAKLASVEAGPGSASSIVIRTGMLNAEPKPTASPLGKPEISLKTFSFPFSIACRNALRSLSLVNLNDNQLEHIARTVDESSDGLCVLTIHEQPNLRPSLANRS